jgi:hypothetical protein
MLISPSSSSLQRANIASNHFNVVITAAADGPSVSVRLLAVRPSTTQKRPQRFKELATSRIDGRQCLTLNSNENSQRLNKTPTSQAETLQRLTNILPTSQPAPKVEKEPDFDWSDDEVVVVRQQSAIAVFRNHHGDVVVRQQGDTGYFEDSWVIISQQYLVPVIDALNALERREDGYDE